MCLINGSNNVGQRARASKEEPAKQRLKRERENQYYFEFLFFFFWWDHHRINRNFYLKVNGPWLKFKSERDGSCFPTKRTTRQGFGPKDKVWVWHCWSGPKLFTWNPTTTTGSSIRTSTHYLKWPYNVSNVVGGWDLLKFLGYVCFFTFCFISFIFVEFLKS